MKKSKLFVAIAVFGIISCGSPTPKEAGENENKEAVSEDAHEGMDHTTAGEDGKELLPVPEAARVFFKNLQDGDAVKSPFVVEFGVEGMEVEPAGALSAEKGHHHLIIDGNYVKRGVVVPADSMHIHYGAGQTEAEISLAPGEHYLTMQFADGYHQSYGDQMSATVLVIVEE